MGQCTLQQTAKASTGTCHLLKFLSLIVVELAFISMCIMSQEVSFEEQETVLNVCGTCSVIMNAGTKVRIAVRRGTCRQCLVTD